MLQRKETTDNIKCTVSVILKISSAILHVLHTRYLNEFRSMAAFKYNCEVQYIYVTKRFIFQFRVNDPNVLLLN